MRNQMSWFLATQMRPSRIFTKEMLDEFGLLDDIMDRLISLRYIGNETDCICLLEALPVYIEGGISIRAGSATENWIALHSRLFVPGDEAQLEETIRHELAHVVAKRYLKAHGHNEIWRQTALHLGSNGKTYHKFEPLSRKVLAKWEYECRDCGYIYHQHRKLANAAFRFHDKCRNKPHKGLLIERLKDRVAASKASF